MDTELHQAAQHSFKTARALSTIAPSESRKPGAWQVSLCVRETALRLLRPAFDRLRQRAGLHAAFTSELVVVDNGSTDDTPEYVTGVAATSDIVITTACGSASGLSRRTQSRATARSRGSIVIFIDDDCEVHHRLSP